MSPDDRCADCGRAVALRGNGPGRRMLCGACDARARAVECSRCGERRPANRRDAVGAICRTCARRDDAAAATTALRGQVAVVVAEVEPDLDRATIDAAVAVAAPNRRHTAGLAEALATIPDALSGSSLAPPVVDRLVAALVAGGATSVRPPSCHGCGTTRWLTQRVDGMRACNWCAIKARAQCCGRCGRVGPVSTRDRDGAAVCSSCRALDAATFEVCSRCSRRRRVANRTPEGALCGGCARGHPVVACAGCGRTRPATSSGRQGEARCSSCSRRRERCSRCGTDDAIVAVVWAGGPVCSTCYKRAAGARGTCAGCGHRRRIDPRDPDQRQLCSGCAGLQPWSVCSSCGAEDLLYEAGRCRSCTIERRLPSLLGDSPILAPLRASLVGSDRARATLRWLSKPECAELLAALARGEVAVTHEALDERPATKALDHFRAVLVAAGVLPERDEQTARLEAWVVDQLGAMAIDEDRKVVEAFARWWVLQRYRMRRSRSGVASDDHARRLVRGAVEFLAWARGHGLVLASCTQAHVELWMAGPPGRKHARGFLRWACRHRLAHDLDIVRRADPNPARSAHADDHLVVAHRFATDATLPLVDRVAGLLLLCYAQPLARLSRLRVDDITAGPTATLVRFGRTQIELSEPVGRLVADLVADRRGRATTGASGQSRWLFVGAQPGRPLGANQLGVRLAAYGIDARAARSALLLDLAGELAPGVLADLLGMHPGTAVRWVRAASGDWSGYAGSRARGGVDGEPGREREPDPVQPPGGTHPVVAERPTTIEVGVGPGDQGLEGVVRTELGEAGAHRVAVEVGDR
ncbi:MAG TPA: hypothetical protein VFJ85_01005 [Acidimicrobiales bacterium]|nr:hypothetical protein [Acidimicrobiales bacterium]